MVVIEEIITTYASDTDMTFILRETYSEDSEVWLSTEVVGFYHGEPSEDLTQRYIGKIKAVYA